MNTKIPFPVLLVILFICVGCSHAASIVEPASVKSIDATTTQSHCLLGEYTFTCDPVRSQVDISPLRFGSLHLNALKFLEPPVNINLTLEGPIKLNGNILDVDIGLRNPFLAMPQYTGFDVCGIVFSHGSVSGFNDPELVMVGGGDTRLLNPDGFTRWWNPAEFPHGDTIFNYKDGLLGTPAETSNFNCTINGYKYFANGLGKNDPLTLLDPAKRGMFAAGAKIVRHYTLDISGGLVFNYAVDVCWALPQGDPPYKVPDCFPQKANRTEAYNIVVTELMNSLFFNEVAGFGGGNLKLLVELRDHFDSQLNTISGESLVGLPYATGELLGGGDDSAFYELEFPGAAVKHSGEVDLLITAQSEALDYSGFLPGKPVCGYFIYRVNVTNKPPLGWAHTWGSDYVPVGYPNYYTGVDEQGSDMIVSPDGKIYVTGYFGNTVDFDPGPGEQWRTSYGCFDAFLSKFDPNGKFEWVLTWGAEGYDRGIAVTTDISGKIYVTGDFMGSVDFDPGPNSHIADSHSTYYNDSFLVKFTPEGQYVWSLTWGGTGAVEPYKTALNNAGEIFVVGEYRGIVDFDPGPGVDEHGYEGDWFDAFLMKLDANGDYIYSRTWGGYGRSRAMCLAFDNEDNIYVSGNFECDCDFDPGPGIEEHNALGYEDAYLSRFDPAGEFQWVRVWGGPLGYDHANVVLVSASNVVYVAGRFVGDVDLDPGPDSEIYSTGGDNADVFFTMFNTSGDFLWTRVWGNTGNDVCKDGAIDANGNLCIAGFFSGTVDFDPGPGIAENVSVGGLDAFVSVFNPDGNFLWARTWGGDAISPWHDITFGAAFDSAGNLYATGLFDGTADFWPGPHVDNHTSNGGADCFLVMFPPDGDW